MKKLKYLIYSPRNNPGGVIALHNLCNLLSKKGIIELIALYRKIGI